MILYYFMYLFHHKYLVYNYSANGETDEPLFKTIRELHKFDINKCNRKRLRDSILSPFFHSYIFAMYKNEALWI